MSKAGGYAWVQTSSGGEMRHALAHGPPTEAGALRGARRFVVHRRFAQAARQVRKREEAKQVSGSFFTVVDSDLHGSDGNNNGVGWETWVEREEASDALQGPDKSAGKPNRSGVDAS